MKLKPNVNHRVLANTQSNYVINSNIILVDDCISFKQ